MEHFKTHSLAEYNSHLNCTLDHPLVNQPVRMQDIHNLCLSLECYSGKSTEGQSETYQTCKIVLNKMLLDFFSIGQWLSIKQPKV